MTLSPRASEETRSPISLTSPAASLPGTKGGSALTWYCPRACGKVDQLAWNRPERDGSISTVVTAVLPQPAALALHAHSSAAPQPLWTQRQHIRRRLAYAS